MNERNQTNDLHSLSHTKWNCKYHVVIILKYAVPDYMEFLKLK